MKAIILSFLGNLIIVGRKDRSEIDIFPFEDNDIMIHK